MYSNYFYVHFYYKMHIEKHGLQQYGDRFTFTICSYFHRTGIVVPLYSHATKSNSIPKNHSTHIFGQNLTIPYQNSPSTSPQESQQNTPNPIPSLPYPT